MVNLAAEKNSSYFYFYSGHNNKRVAKLCQFHIGRKIYQMLLSGDITFISLMDKNVLPRRAIEEKRAKLWKNEKEIKKKSSNFGNLVKYAIIFYIGRDNRHDLKGK